MCESDSRKRGRVARAARRVGANCTADTSSPQPAAFGGHPPPLRAELSGE